MKEVGEQKMRSMRRWIATAVFLLSLALYALTAEPTASYWDCPEYVTTAARLEPGHPPGNPVWMLTARVFTMLAPSAQAQAYMVNLMSGVCSAVAVLLLFLTLTIFIRRLVVPPEHGGKFTPRQTLMILGGSLCGSLCLAVSDTFWFSAIEAEVYAMSAMLTALSLWLTFLWGENMGKPYASRYLVLTAYVTGLAIGVHQLNLLTLPVSALVILFYRRDNLRPGMLIMAMAASLVAIAAVLFGMMPAALALAGKLELLAVNTFHLPMHSGVLAYAAVTIAVLIATAAVTNGEKRRILSLTLTALALWLCGLLSFGGNAAVGAAICALLLAAGIMCRRRISMAVCNITVWSAAMLFLGYCSYSLIMIRGAAAPPMNQGAPGNIFALQSYIHRDQYGSDPLLYGPTPYSKPLYVEDMAKDSVTGRMTASYTRPFRYGGKTVYHPMPDSTGRMQYSGMLVGQKMRYPPELNMWFPRIYSPDPDDIETYSGWAGMTRENMDTVEVSYAVDSAGNAVGKYDNLTGKRTKETGLRPTYWQNLAMLGGYQMSYMYFRYLLWNFVGRQNEVYAQGESDAGNFITGIAPVDELMLGDISKMPDDIGRGNPGHHAYWLLPLLLGIVGIAYQFARSRRQFAVTLLLFILTGVAIVVYLNQTPGQPRERDYSFVGSFYAWCIWIGIGATSLIEAALSAWGGRRRRAVRRPLAAALVLAVVATPVIMLAENLPDHNRAGRTITRDIALNIVNPLPQNAILFMNGDNYTFPLWYIQETEGVRTDIRTINLAYIATPWYIAQLAMPTDGGKPVKLSIPPEKLNAVAMQAYNTVDIGCGTADAREALHRLFREKPTPGKRLCIAADRLRFAVPGAADSVTVDLRSVAGGRSSLRLKKLMILDIIANNADLRPVCWIAVLGDDDKAGLAAYTHREGLSRILGVTDEYTSASRTANIILGRFNDCGVCRAHYIDVPGRMQVNLIRHLMASTALQLLDRDSVPADRNKALRLAQLSQQWFPSSIVPYTSNRSGGVTYSNGGELARIYHKLWELTGNDAYRREAERLAYAELERCASYSRYLSSLSPRYRRYTKATTRLSRNTLYESVQILMDLGVDSLRIVNSPVLRGIDVQRHRDIWLKTIESQQ